MVEISYGLILGLALLLITALGGNYYFYKKEEAEAERKRRLRYLKHRLALLLETLSQLKRAHCPAPTIDLLNDHAIYFFKQIQQLNNKNSQIERLSNTLASPAPDLTPIISEKSITEAQRGIKHALHVLPILKQKGKLNVQQLGQYQNELVWLHAKIEAQAHIELGIKLMANKKLTMAHSHFRHAKNTLSKNPATNPEKKNLLEQLDKLLFESNAYSTELVKALSEEMKNQDQPSNLQDNN